MNANVSRTDLDEAAQVLDKLTDIRISNVAVDSESVHLELDSGSAISDATVIAARLGLPVSTVAPGFTEWYGSLSSGADITVLAYGDPNITIVRERSRYRFGPAVLLAASAAAGAALSLAVGRIARVAR